MKIVKNAVTCIKENYQILGVTNAVILVVAHYLLIQLSRYNDSKSLSGEHYA